MQDTVNLLSDDSSSQPTEEGAHDIPPIDFTDSAAGPTDGVPTAAAIPHESSRESTAPSPQGDSLYDPVQNTTKPSNKKRSSPTSSRSRSTSLPKRTRRDIHQATPTSPAPTRASLSTVRSHFFNDVQLIKSYVDANVVGPTPTPEQAEYITKKIRDLPTPPDLDNQSEDGPPRNIFGRDGSP